MPHHLPNHPGAALIRTNPDGTRIWRQRPINFANHRTVAEVDAGQLVSRTNDIFIPIAAAPSAGEGGRPAAMACAGSSSAQGFNFDHAATANGEAVQHHA